MDNNDNNSNKIVIEKINVNYFIKLKKVTF